MHGPHTTGILSVFDAGSGRPHYQLQRLSGLPEVYSSPVAARGRVDITSHDGTTLVIRHGSRFDVLATNSPDDGFDASPALVDNELYLRGNRYLYCIAEPVSGRPAPPSRFIAPALPMAQSSRPPLRLCTPLP